MAKSQSKPLVGKHVSAPTSSMGQLPLSQLLINVKTGRSRLNRAKDISGPAYDQFSDDICQLYDWLDNHSIGQIERIVKG